jgi:hypothetical protein
MSIFPNVPNVPGVPPLLRNPNLGSAAISLLVNQAIRFLVAPFSAQWGIYRDGLPVVIADSVVSFGYKQDWTIADYPVEEGAFESYDKVETPFGIRVRFASGGSTANRQELINSIEAIAGDLELYDVVTPEQVYTSVNITHYDYHRDAKSGVGLLLLDVWLIEVRVTAQASFANTKSPTAAGTTNGGTVNPTSATPTQQSLAPEVE